MNDSAKEEAKEWIKDIAMAVAVVAIIMGSLYAYTGMWPPMVVVESGSMQHSEDRSYIGVIDTGDIVLSKETSFSDIITYVEGRATGYQKYGDYGDVIIYRPMGKDTTPIIHRAVLYLEWNSSSAFDVEGLSALEYGSDYSTDSGSWHGIRQEITIYNYGYAHRELRIDVGSLLRYHHSGYITGGDHNIGRGYGTDQNTGICPEPVRKEWVRAKAVGELPWFGLIKLTFTGSIHENPAPTNSWVMLILTIALLLILPSVAERAYARIRPGVSEDEGPEAEGPGDQADEEDTSTKGI